MGETRTRFCIIGAGASGVATANALRKAGHKDVVVLESGPTVGGKCSTLWYKGRTYELGAAIITPAYKRTWALMKEHGISPNLRVSARFVNTIDRRMAAMPFVPPSVGWNALKLPVELARLWREHLAPRLQAFPRLDEVPQDLCEPFEPWARRHGFSNVLEVIRPWTTSFGYGFMEEVPAAYVLNYMCVMGVSFELHDTGYGGLWQRVAQGLDVRLNSPVLKVTRADDGARIETSREVIHADKVIITCPLENALSFLDASDEERALFSSVKAMDYQVIAANTEDMPKQSYVFIPNNFPQERCGKPMFYYRRYRDSGVITFYSFAGRDGLDGAEREVHALVRDLGGKVTEVLTRRAYRYFPHVSAETMASGFHRRIEALQGQRHTYYAGEVLSFSCVEPVVAYAEQLVSRMLSARAIDARDLPAMDPANTVQRVRAAG